MGNHKLPTRLEALMSNTKYYNTILQRTHHTLIDCGPSLPTPHHTIWIGFVGASVRHGGRGRNKKKGVRGTARDNKVTGRLCCCFSGAPFELISYQNYILCILWHFKTIQYLYPLCQPVNVELVISTFAYHRLYLSIIHHYFSHNIHVLFESAHNFEGYCCCWLVLYFYFFQVLISWLILLMILLCM